MTAALVLLYSSAIIVVGVFLFIAVDWLEPNHRLALVFKCAILAAGGAVIARVALTLDDFFTQFAEQRASEQEAAQIAPRGCPRTAMFGAEVGSLR